MLRFSQFVEMMMSEGRVLPSLISKEPEKEHSKQYQDRVDSENDRKSRARTNAEINRFLKAPHFGRPWKPRKEKDER